MPSVFKTVAVVIKPTETQTKALEHVISILEAHDIKVLLCENRARLMGDRCRWESYQRPI